MTMMIRNLSGYVQALERMWTLVYRRAPGGHLPAEYKMLQEEVSLYEAVHRPEVIKSTRALTAYYFARTPKSQVDKFSFFTWLFEQFFPPEAELPWRFALTMGPVRYDNEDPSFMEKKMERIMRTADQVETFRINGGTDSDGNAVDLGAINKPEWVAGNPESVALTVADDGLSAQFKYEKQGVSIVTITSKDAEGNPVIERQIEVEVSAGKLAGFGIASDGPTSGE